MSKYKIILSIFILVLAGGYFIYSNKFSTGNKKVDEIEKKAGITGGIIVPSKLIQCTPEILAEDCEKTALKTVCGYDHAIYESGKERDNVLQFKSGCHYCRFYGMEEKNIAGTRINGLGFEEKPCNQGMYKKQ